MRDRALARGAHRGERQHVDGGAGEWRALDGALDEAGEDRLEPVMVAVVEVIGLGGGEQDAVDPPRHQPAQPAGPAEPEGGEDLGERLLEIGAPPRGRR